jgi:hypothetical protein
MRVKELKNLLERLPEDTEILIRCQNHERPVTGSRETVDIVSVTPNIGETKKYLMFNPSRAVRLYTYVPQPTDMVSCMSCTRKKRIETCVKRGKICEECTANCECKNCGHFNIDQEDVFAHKPNYEKDTTKNYR